MGGLHLVFSTLKSPGQHASVVKKCVELFNVHLAPEDHFPDATAEILKSDVDKRSALDGLLGSAFVERMIATFS
jgi:hypothetical protein